MRIIPSTNDTTNPGTMPMLFGVPAKWLLQRPTVQRIPPGFNQTLPDMWTKALETLDKDAEPQEQWATAVKEFVRAANQKNVVPFAPSHLDQGGNAWIQSYLFLARNHAVQYLKATKLLDIIDPSDVATKIKLTELGFLVGSTLTGTYDGGVNVLTKLLASPEFKLHRVVNDSGMTFARALLPNVWFSVTLLSGKRLRFAFTISVNHHPLIPNFEEKKVGQIKRWIDRNMWRPVVRSLPVRRSIPVRFQSF